MSSILSAYTVMQQCEWAGRRFYTARDRRSGQVVYLVAEPAQGSTEPYRQSGLPGLEPVALEGDTRWLVAELPAGDTLEDLRSEGRLTESDIAAALLTTCNALAALATLSPPPVPGYLDPACIKRDPVGRWTLDFLALAQATEARGAVSAPPGVYPMGVLLYWLVTGQAVRRSRVQFDRAEHQMSPALQFILIRCLGKVYPGLAELRADLERAGREREFRALAVRPELKSEPKPDLKPAPKPEPAAEAPEPRLTGGVEFHRVTLGGPNIPLNDRPWALPPRPADGFRRYVVPPPPDNKTVRRNRFVVMGVAGAVAATVAGGVAWKSGLIPGLSAGAVAPAPPASSPMPDFTQPSVVLGPEPPPPQAPAATPEPTTPPADTNPNRDPFTSGTGEPQPAPAQPVPTQPAPARPVTAAPKPAQSAPTQPAPVQPAPVQTPPAAAQRPTPPALVPGSPEELDAGQGGLATLVYVNGRPGEWAWLIPHPSSPYITLPAFNRLFRQELLWAPHDGNTVRLYSGSRSVVTGDFTVVRGRLWLKLTPPLQQILGVQVNAYTTEGLFFTVS